MINYVPMRHGCLQGGAPQRKWQKMCSAQRFFNLSFLSYISAYVQLQSPPGEINSSPAVRYMRLITAFLFFLLFHLYYGTFPQSQWECKGKGLVFVWWMWEWVSVNRANRFHMLSFTRLYAFSQNVIFSFFSSQTSLRSHCSRRAWSRGLEAQFCSIWKYVVHKNV